MSEPNRVLEQFETEFVISGRVAAEAKCIDDSLLLSLLRLAPLVELHHTLDADQAAAGVPVQGPDESLFSALCAVGDLHVELRVHRANHCRHSVTYLQATQNRRRHLGCLRILLSGYHSNMIAIVELLVIVMKEDTLRES
jgi:hypothetical protein